MVRWRIEMGWFACLSIGVLGCLLVGAFKDGNKDGSCRFNFWLNYKGNCYGYFSEEMSWADAENKCQSHRWNLVCLENSEVHDALAAFLIKSGVYKDVWVKPPLRETTSKKKLSEFCPVMSKDLEFKHLKYVSCKNSLPYVCEIGSR